jgi:hypothetical protein
MTKTTFEEDVFSRKATRFLLILQIVSLPIVFLLIIFKLNLLALVLSLLTFVIFCISVIWLYMGYRKKPLVQEKRAYGKRVNV